MSAWIETIVAQLGYAGIALLMFAETLFPPLPSEVIMPLAGMEAGRGSLSMPGVIAAGTTGAMAGNIAWYLLARALGADRLRGIVERYGRWLTLRWPDVEAARRRFRRHGVLYVCLARLIPTVRSMVSIPAGLLAMPLPAFIGWSFLGTLAWTSALTFAGAFLGRRFPEVQTLVGWGSIAVIGALLGWYLWRVARWHRS